MNALPIPDLPAGVTHKVHCEAHDTLVGWLKSDDFIGFSPCGECPCPAGGAHEWGILEQAGTGHTWAGCENCGASRPAEEM
jgi:hypothetical protein